VLTPGYNEWTDCHRAAAGGYREIVLRLADRAAAFGRPVVLFEGDSHEYTVDHPLVAGSPLHGVTTAAPNLTRIIVAGETAVDEWLKLTADPDSSPNDPARRGSDPRLATSRTSAANCAS
jgi:hypothetical protein